MIHTSESLKALDDTFENFHYALEDGEQYALTDGELDWLKFTRGRYAIADYIRANSEISDDGRLVYTVEQDGINDALKADGLQSVPMLSEESTLYAICWYLFMD